MMARSLAAGQQHEVNPWDPRTDEQRNQLERHHCNWLVAAVTLTLIVLVIYLTSKCWRWPLLEVASRYAWQRTGVPAMGARFKASGHTHVCLVYDRRRLYNGREIYYGRRCRNQCRKNRRFCDADDGTLRVAGERHGRCGRKPSRHLAQISWREVLPAGTVPTLKVWWTLNWQITTWCPGSEVKHMHSPWCGIPMENLRWTMRRCGSPVLSLPARPYYKIMI